jgi:hypothetical protein
MDSTPVKPKPMARSSAESAAGNRPFGGAQGQAMSGSPGGVQESLAAPRIIAPTLLMPAEVVIFELKPSLWYVVFVSVPIAAIGAAILFFSWTIHELPESLRHGGAVIGMGIVGLRVAVALLEWLGRTYVLTDRRVLKQYGVVDVEVRSLGLEDVSNSFVAQAAAQRLLGIGTIFFQSSAAHGDLAWEHVRRPDKIHARVVDQIARWKRSQALAKPPVPPV